jgi:hypothetical protein
MLTDFHGASSGENVTRQQDEQEPQQPYIRGIQVSRQVALP